MTGKNNAAGASSNPVESELHGKKNHIEEKDGPLRHGLNNHLWDVPPHVQRSYIEIDGKYYFAGRPDFLPFEDRGRLPVRDRIEFRREVWLHAAEKGIEVNGYTPLEEDLARLKKVSRNQNPERAGGKAEPKRKDRGEPRNKPRQPGTKDGPAEETRGNADQSKQVNPHRDQREAKAEALRNEREDLTRLAKEKPDLVNEFAVIKIGEKMSRNFAKEYDRQRFMGFVRERVADNYLKGLETAVIKVREERTIERSNRERRAANER